MNKKSIIGIILIFGIFVGYMWWIAPSKEEIAEQLYLSAHTVNNHIRNAYFRLGIHSKAEFVKYAENNRLFQ